MTLRTLALPSLAVAFAVLFACGGDTPDAPPAAADAPAEAPAADPLPDKLDVDGAGGDAEYAKVPPPGELQLALQRAGIETTIASMVPDRTFQLDASDPDRVAVRTGVVVADILLTVETSSDDKLLSQLALVKQGMSILGGGADIDRTITDLSDRVKAGAVQRKALVVELDELAQVVIPELEFNGVARIVPLIQAGSWLSGASLVAKAVQAKQQPAAADAILKQPEVVRYFKRYAKEEGEGKVPSMVASALDASLSQLEAVAAKDGSLTGEDVDVVINATGSVLSLL